MASSTSITLLRTSTTITSKPNIIKNLHFILSWYYHSMEFFTFYKIRRSSHKSRAHHFLQEKEKKKKKFNYTFSPQHHLMCQNSSQCFACVILVVNLLLLFQFSTILIVKWWKEQADVISRVIKIMKKYWHGCQVREKKEKKKEKEKEKKKTILN